ncbi:MAG: MFS transporter [Cyclobacteriaceae bacterium]|nr:MFS transporter [Cyclobacteriaceae bacterium]
MLVPGLFIYLPSIGGAEYIGLIISLFTVTAMISRPLSGKLADRIGRKPVIMAGALVCFICSLLYPVLTTVFGFLFLRLLHGFSTGFTPTGEAAYISDIIPPDRRGEAMGLMGTSSSLGMASGLSFGGWFISTYSMESLFYCSSAFAILSALIVITIKETVKEKHAITYRLLLVSKVDLFEPRVIMPCVVMGLCAYAYGTLFTIATDYSTFFAIENKGLLFTYFTIASLMIRLLAGRASDTYGRVRVLKFSTMIMTIAMGIIAFASTKMMLIIGVFMYGLGQGANSPTLLAWAADLSLPEHRGRGLASLYILMEFGIGIGAFFSGLIYVNNPLQFYIPFGVGGILSFIAFLYLWTRPSRVSAFK